MTHYNTTNEKEKIILEFTKIYELDEYGDQVGLDQSTKHEFENFQSITFDLKSSDSKQFQDIGITQIDLKPAYLAKLLVINKLVLWEENYLSSIVLVKSS